MTEKLLNWNECNNNIVSCCNLEKEFLGYLRYERVGCHMHWCWYQDLGIRMSPGCLQEVRDKQKELLNLVRQGVKK